VSASYTDVVESIIKELIETRHCVEKAEIAEAVGRRLETSPHSIRALISTALKKLAKRGEVHISEGWVCRSVYIEQRVVELLKVHYVPKQLALVFSVLMNIVRKNGMLDPEAVSTFRDAVKASRRERLEIGVAYEPRDICDAVLALAVFMYIKDGDYDPRDRRGLPYNVYLALPEAVVADLLLSRVLFEKDEGACGVKCFEWLEELEAPSDSADVVQIHGVGRNGYSPESLLASHVNADRDRAFGSKILRVASKAVDVERCVFEIRRERRVLYEISEYVWDTPRGCVFSGPQCPRYRIYCMRDGVELHRDIFAKLGNICWNLSFYRDPEHKLLKLYKYLRIKPKEASKPIEF
jgi:hypothetical protein